MSLLTCSDGHKKIIYEGFDGDRAEESDNCPLCAVNEKLACIGRELSLLKEEKNKWIAHSEHSHGFVQGCPLCEEILNDFTGWVKGSDSK